MALRASDWLPNDPAHDDAVREFIKEITHGVDKLAESLDGDELLALATKALMFRELHLSESNLKSSAGDVEARRIREAPEPLGVDWACETPQRAADVVVACRLSDRRKTGEDGRWWPNRVMRLMQGERRYISPRTWNRWRRGEEPVDRSIVVAALKVALVEDARELNLKALRRYAAART